MKGLVWRTGTLNPSVLWENESNIVIMLTKTQCFNFVVVLQATLFNNWEELNNIQKSYNSSMRIFGDLTIKPPHKNLHNSWNRFSLSLLNCESLFNLWSWCGVQRDLWISCGKFWMSCLFTYRISNFLGSCIEGKRRMSCRSETFLLV